MNNRRLIISIYKKVMFLLFIFTSISVSQEIKPLDIINGWEGNLAKLQSGEGRIVWELSGDYYSAGEGVRLDDSFAFDDTKLRFDREENGKLIYKKAISNNAILAYETSPSQNITAYIDHAPNMEGLLDVGKPLNYKRLFEHTSFPHEGIKYLLENNSDIIESVNNNDGTYLLKITVDATSGPQQYLLTFDINKGCNLVREQYIVYDYVVSDTVRDYELKDGVWCISSLKLTRYKLRSKDIDGTMSMTVDNFLPNEPISPNTFSFVGFDLPPRARIYDYISNINYTLDPVQAIEQQLDVIMETAGVIESNAIKQPLDKMEIVEQKSQYSEDIQLNKSEKTENEDKDIVLANSSEEIYETMQNGRGKLFIWIGFISVIVLGLLLYKVVIKR